MKNQNTHWRLPVTGALLFATAVSAEQDLQTYLNSTNRVTLSLRFGLNISGGFKGVGTTFAPGAPLANPQYTRHGDKYNYDDGFALADVSGSKDGYTWYWGYDSTSQINESKPNTIDLHRTDAIGLPKNGVGDDSPYLGFELAYDYQLKRDDWRNLYYGIEVALNWMPISFGGTTAYNLSLSHVTDTYGYTPGTTVPTTQVPYQGDYAAGNFSIFYPRISTSSTLSSATLLVQQAFDADLWGIRLGPYIEYMPSEKWNLHLSGGLALGILDADASWKETLTVPGGGPGSSTSVSGSGNDVALLAGFYVGLDAEYKFNDRWSVQAGVQYQDIGAYNHNFGGRTVGLDLSNSIFVQAGVSYSF
jgi:hypothetical protein